MVREGPDGQGDTDPNENIPDRSETQTEEAKRPDHFVEEVPKGNKNGATVIDDISGTFNRIMGVDGRPGGRTPSGNPPTGNPPGNPPRTPPRKPPRP